MMRAAHVLGPQTVSPGSNAPLSRTAAAWQQPARRSLATSTTRHQSDNPIHEVAPRAAGLPASHEHLQRYWHQAGASPHLSVAHAVQQTGEP
eukprot:6314298-Pyramimonas_sp.AAC.1